MKTPDTLKIIITLLIAIVLLGSCTKEPFGKCRASCAKIIISGQVWDSSYRKGLANLPVKIYWKDAGMCPICPESVIGNSNTDANGRFYFNMSIDSSRFHGNNLHVAAQLPADYIANTSHNRFVDESFGQYNQSIQNIKFVMFQAAKLNIKLQRTQTDHYIGFEIFYRFAFTRFGIYGYFGPPPSPYTDFNVTTAANVYTKVSWHKAHSPGVFTDFEDSVKCVANADNRIVLNY